MEGKFRHRAHSNPSCSAEEAVVVIWNYGGTKMCVLAAEIPQDIKLVAALLETPLEAFLRDSCCRFVGCIEFPPHDWLIGYLS